ncbi:MAG: hypothetical protein IBX57_00225 [Gammaproteobacteria bacterium]|nr:hypothetical protein [Gammaproteobacteria bacterium]
MNKKKGVIVGVWPDEKMPVDRNGNRAEIIMDGDATIKRMNIGRLYEQWLNACSRDVTNRVRDMVENDHKNGWQQAYDYLLGYYEICSPRMRALFDKYPKPKQHVEEILKDGVYLWLPTDNPRDSMEAIKMLKDGPYAPTFGPVTYAEGVVTDRNVLIGSLYIMLLEKTGSDWSGVSSAKLQHFGIPARVSNSDKYSSPGRNQPVRILGESEVRLLNSVIGSDTTVDMLDQSNSPTTHKYIVNKILRSDQPTNIDVMVDRKEVPLGNARSNLFVKHIMECGGVKFVREIDDPIRAQDVENQLKGKG